MQKRIYDDSDSQLKKQLTKNEYNFFISNSSEKNSYKYSSYFSVFQSQLTIASSSTMLKERLGTGGKVLACNYTNLNFNDFPVKGICFLKKKKDYETFSTRVDKILSLSKKSYFSRLDKDKKYVLNFNKSISGNKLISKEIDNLLHQTK